MLSLFEVRSIQAASPRAVLAQEKMLLVSCGSFAKRCWCQSLESGFFETKGFFRSFVFQRLSFLHTLFLENEAQTNKINYRTMFFMSTQVSLPKISLILQKMKNPLKKRYTPFLQEALQLFCFENWHSSQVCLRLHSQ